MKYDIHNTVFQVSCAVPRIDPVIRETFRYFGLPAAGDASDGPNIDVSFVSAEAILPASGGAFRAVSLDNGFKAVRAGRRLFIYDACSSMQLDTAAGTGIGTLSPRLLEQPLALHRTVFILLLSSLILLLRRRHLYAMHAAALARGGRGVLLVAGSDCGKSTIAYSLVRRGWHYLSDDTILLRDSGASIEALSFRKTFALDLEARTYFPEIAPGAAYSDQEKLYLSMDVLYPSQEAERCIPGVLIFPEIVDRRESRFSPIARTEVMRRLLEQSGLLTLEPETVPGHLELLRRLVAQTQSYRLLAGRDLKAEPTLIAPMLETILSDVPCYPA